MNESAVARGEVERLFDPAFVPAPMDERAGAGPDRRVIVIGAGPGGIIAALRLHQAGYDDVVVLEKASGPGGTWHHNRYPGAACDVQAHLYSFSFSPNPDWSRPYAPQPELLAYFERVVDDFDLRSMMRFGVEVRHATWNDESTEWTLITSDGESIVADVVISAVGMFNELVHPDIAGLDTFAGPSFHTARWPESLDLTGRRVGVIGSAATAIQLVPAIAGQVEHLTVFQRSAPWVMPKLDDPFTDVERARFSADPSSRLDVRRALWDRVEGAILFTPDSVAKSVAAAEANLAVVTDPIVRERLRPTVPFGCSRPLTSSDYYPTFNRSNVELVVDAIDLVSPTGVSTIDGRHHECDVLIIATGFAATKYLSVIDVTGRDGMRLDEAWNDGAIAWFGVATHGFPNLFQLYGPNTNNGSIVYMLECQVDLVVRTLQSMDRDGSGAVEIRADVQDDFNEAIQRDIDAVGVWGSDCSNYYSSGGRVVTQWPRTMADYRAGSLAVTDDLWLRRPAGEF